MSSEEEEGKQAQAQVTAEELPAWDDGGCGWFNPRLSRRAQQELSQLGDHQVTTWHLMDIRHKNSSLRSREINRTPENCIYPLREVLWNKDATRYHQCSTVLNKVSHDRGRLLVF